MEPVAIRCSFRSRGYSEEEISKLSESLSEFASLQPRRQGLPEAGGVYEISFIVQFLGELVATGIAYDIIKKLSLKLLDFYRSKQIKEGEPPEMELIELRFNNVDLRLCGGEPEEGPDCNFLTETTLDHLPELVSEIFDHISSEPLKSADLLVVTIFEPVVSKDIEGETVFDFKQPWKISGVDFMAPTQYCANSRKLQGEYQGYY